MEDTRTGHLDAARETVVLGGGCFWCVEAVFAVVDGVTEAISGYAGGGPGAPTYEQVCSGATGFAEVVRVAFDPGVIGLREILEIFFSVHDPTTPNRQGADTGPQYRSVVFAADGVQAALARQVIAELEEQQLFSGPIVTEVAPLDRFHPAEERHQRYFARNPDQAYCRAVISPKMTRFREKFAHRLKRS